MKKLLFAVLMLAASVSYAVAPTTTEKRFQGIGTSFNLIDGTSCGAAATSRTITKTVSGYSKLLQYVGLVDADSSVTALTITCSRSLDGSSFGYIPTRSISSGASTMSPLVDTWASKPPTLTPDFDCFGWAAYRCVYACTGTPSTADKIYVQWTATVGK